MGGTFMEEELLELGARLVSQAEVQASTGAEREAWRTAAEAEVQESFFRLGAVSDTTPE